MPISAVQLSFRDTQQHTHAAPCTGLESLTVLVHDLDCLESVPVSLHTTSHTLHSENNGENLQATHTALSGIYLHCL